jgi:hypothetical protein
MSTITKKGQVTIPKPFRDVSWAGLWAEQYVYWYLGDMMVIMVVGFSLVMFGAPAA